MPRSSFFLPLVLACCVGCAEDIPGPAGVDEPFSMYSIFNPRMDTQTVLVLPIEDRLAPLGPEIDAAVTSTDLATGETQAWSDSVVVNDTGQLDHIFWAPFRPAFGSRHRVEVVRSDGARSSAETDVPALVTVDQADSETRNLSVVLEGGDFRIIRLDVTYEVGFFRVRDAFQGPRATYTRSYKGTEIRTESGWAVPIDMTTYYETMRLLYFDDHYPNGFPGFRNPSCDGLGLFAIRLDVTVGNAAWNPPGDAFDPTVLGDPGTLTNVTNGYGFVGAGYRYEGLAVHASGEAVADTPFFDFMDGRTPELSGCGRPFGT